MKIDSMRLMAIEYAFTYFRSYFYFSYGWFAYKQLDRSIVQWDPDRLIDTGSCVMAA